MKFKNFSISAYTRIVDAHCDCRAELVEVSNGFLSSAMYCPKCENVYILKLVKVPKSKINDAFLKQSREEYQLKNKGAKHG